MVAAAVAQLAVPLVASAIGDSKMSAIWAPEVIVITVLFTAMWLVSASMFKSAASASNDHRAGSGK